LQEHRKFLSKNCQDLEDLRVGGRIILKLLFNIENVRFWTGFNLLRTVTTGFCEYDNGLSGYVTCGKFIG
jgi:hypothetical protein